MRFVFIAAALLAIARAADDLPKKQPDEAMDFEPGLLLPDLTRAPEPADSAAKLETTLDRAKRSAASGERLFRAGIIAKVEAERRTLKVIRLTADLACARAEAAKLELEGKRGDFDAGKLPQDQFETAKASAQAAAETAASAAAAWQRAEFAAAELNLRRQHQLAAAGIGSKSLLSRAQSQVSSLKSKLPP